MKTIRFYLYSSILITLLSLSACYYKPFIKYSLNKKGFKNFSKKEQLAGNNTNPQRAYKVNKYDWDIEVFPSKKRIAGNMSISFTPELNQDTFLFDLQKKLKINRFTTTTANATIKRKGDLLYLIFEENRPAKKRIQFSIDYEGKPVIISKEGPIQWKKDDVGRDWISTVTEGIGPHFMMPCNILLSNEPDTTSIRITVPQQLTVAANGRLISVTEKKGKKTFHHLVTNPINIYNISFNIGHFVKLTKLYTDINGVDREIECYVMDYRKEIADEYYDQVPVLMKHFEEMYGSFPWWNDGCKFIESTFSAMEHQSGIAMGDEYFKDWKDEFNMTLIHELAHEWWGNNISGKDYCDIWIHEGMATYSEALMLEKLYDKTEYDKRIQRMINSTYNTIPIHKVCDVVYNSWTNGADQDIYDKGGLMMHSLRIAVNNDPLFLKTLKQIQQTKGSTNMSTEEMVQELNARLGKDYSSLMNWYLYKTKPPALDVFMSKTDRKMYYKWNEAIPFYQKGKIYIDSEDKTTVLTPSNEYQSIQVESGQSFRFNIEKSIYYTINILEEK